MYSTIPLNFSNSDRLLRYTAFPNIDIQSNLIVTKIIHISFHEVHTQIVNAITKVIDSILPFILP